MEIVFLMLEVGDRVLDEGNIATRVVQAELNNTNRSRTSRVLKAAILAIDLRIQTQLLKRQVARSI